jgi:hypothetical protein
MSPVTSAPSPARPRLGALARHPRARLRAHLRLLGAGFAVGLVIAGCSVVPTTTPQPTPADFPGIATELAKRGIKLNDWVSGDAGCTDKTLIPTAIGFDASGLDQEKVTRVRVYIFRNRGSFDRLRASVDDCARSYVTDPAGYENIAQSPFVIAAQGPWGVKFEAAVRDAITVAAGTGD